MRKVLFPAESGLLRGIAVLLGGGVLAHLVGIGLLPLLTRLFSPTEFGTYGTYTGVLAILGAAATLQFANAIVLPASDREGAGLFRLSILSAVGISCAVAMALWLFPGHAVRMTQLPEGSALLWLLPASVLVTGVGQAITGWVTRAKRFGLSAGSLVVRAGVGGASQVVAGVWAPLATTLAAGALAGDALANGFAVLRLPAALRPFAAPPPPSLRSLWTLGWSYRDFALIGVPRNLVNAVSQGLPLLMLADAYGPVVAGHFALTIKALQAPVNALGNALRQVLSKQASDLRNQSRSLFPLFLQATGGLALLTTPFAVIAVLFGRPIFELVFGKSWSVAGEYSGWLSLWMAAMLSSVPATVLASILRWQSALLFYDLALLGARIATLVWGGAAFPAHTTICLFGIVGLAFNVLLILSVGGGLLRRGCRPSTA